MARRGRPSGLYQLGAGRVERAAKSTLAGRTAPQALRVAPEASRASQRVLGLDLAMGTTGWCLLAGGRAVEHGSFMLPDRLRRKSGEEPLADWLGRRAEELARQVGLLVRLHTPDLVGYEYPDTYRRAWSGGSKGREFEVCQALGRVQGFLIARWPEIGGDARLVAVSTSDAKRTATGRVDANKAQVKWALATLRGFDVARWGDDESDALAVALAVTEGRVAC